jgi:two-component system LytT family response regulator
MSQTAIIIDDEDRSRRTLEALLTENFPEISIIAHGKNVKSGLEALEKHNPDIVFLDIQMPDGTGFDLLKQLKNWDFEVIFTTAYDQYAIDAFHLSAIGYLLKPIDEQELHKSVTKAMQLVNANKIETKTKLSTLLENVERGSKVGKLFLPDATGFQAIEIDTLVRLEGDRNYTKLYFADKQTSLSSHNLGWFEKLLTSRGFFRISKSHLINLHHVVRYSKTEGGYIIMSDGSNLPISDNKKDEFRTLFI